MRFLFLNTNLTAFFLNSMIKLRNIRYLTAEKLTFVYILISSLIILISRYGTDTGYELLKARLLIVCAIMGLAYLNCYKDWWIIRIARVALLLSLLSYWYPETYEVNRVLLNYDHVLAAFEQNLFGFQPALVFPERFPQLLCSEIMNMGYFSYYFLIAGSCFYFFFSSPKYFGLFFFVVLFSFYSYYLIYMLFPTAGPQYYFQAIGIDNALNGNFLQLGHYFNYNYKLMDNNNMPGVFFDLVEKSQLLGERPTAAFPSSHVGISTIIMIMIFRYKKYIVFACLIPVYLALVGATVYIQAHYVIDVIMGFVSAFALCYLAIGLYRLINCHEMFHYKRDI